MPKDYPVSAGSTTNRFFNTVLLPLASTIRPDYSEADLSLKRSRDQVKLNWLIRVGEHAVGIKLLHVAPTSRELETTWLGWSRDLAESHAASLVLVEDNMESEFNPIHAQAVLRALLTPESAESSISEQTGLSSMWLIHKNRVTTLRHNK